MLRNATIYLHNRRSIKVEYFLLIKITQSGEKQTKSSSKEIGLSLSIKIKTWREKRFYSTRFIGKRERFSHTSLIQNTTK